MGATIRVTALGNYQVSQGARYVSLVTTDSYATITAAKYVNNNSVDPIYAGDFIFANYGTGSLSTGIFTASLDANNVVTLTPTAGGVVLPVVNNHFANFSGTAGDIADAGYLPSDASKTVVVMASAAVTLNGLVAFGDTAGTVKNPSTTTTTGFGITAATGSFIATTGNLIAGSAAGGNNALMQLFPTTAATGSLRWIAAPNGGNFNVDFTNASFGQATVFTVADPGAATAKLLVSGGSLVSGNFPQFSGTAGLFVDSALAVNKVLFSGIASPDQSIDMVAFDVVVGQAALAAGGAVAMITSSGSKQYKIRTLQLNSNGTNFSGGGGDRLGQVTDGTTVYSVIPAATMQSLVNAGWGITTTLPYPVSAAINTSTVAGANLSFKYSGGTTDYTAGSLVISVVAQRVA